MTTIVDYGMGNLGSIRNMLKKAGSDSVISSESNVLKNASKLILPGVGSFDRAMNNLKELDFIELLNHKALSEKVRVLGICLGMQLLSNSSDEGVSPGFGWINGYVKKFNFLSYPNLKIPQWVGTQ